MATTDTVIPESGIWPEGIYCIQTTDKALGYNATTGVDGPANRQWIQFANRTRYLRELFTRGHTDDGHHQLTDTDFTDDAAITEEYIDLDYATSDLASSIAELLEKASEYVTGLQDGTLSEGSLSLLWELEKLITLGWHYSGGSCVLEMFTDSMTLVESAGATVVRAVVGDDSIDVDTSALIEAGQYYLLTTEDGSESQLVEIKDVLTDYRVRITDTAEISISANGYLRGTNVAPTVLATVADDSFRYISGLISNFVDYSDVTLRIRHTAGTYSAASVSAITESGSLLTVRAQYTDTTSEYVEDIYQIVNITEPFRLLVEYTGLEQEITFNMLYLYSDSTADTTELVEEIHRPTITSYEYDSDSGTWTITGNYYGTLYDYRQLGMDVEVSVYSDFSTVYGSYSEEGEIQTMSGITVPDSGGYVRIRYSDINGSVSRWSVPVYISSEE